MRRTGAQRHPKEEIINAIKLWESGLSLSEISRRIKVRKTTIKYWIDNAGKFKIAYAGQESTNGGGNRFQAQATHYGWALLLRTYKKINSKLGQASFPHMIDLMGKLQDRLPQMTPASGDMKRPVRVLEVKKRLDLEVMEYLKEAKSEEEISTEKEEKESLAAPPVEHQPEESPSAESEPHSSTETKENGANE